MRLSTTSVAAKIRPAAPARRPETAGSCGWVRRCWPMAVCVLMTGSVLDRKPCAIRCSSDLLLVCGHWLSAARNGTETADPPELGSPPSWCARRCGPGVQPATPRRCGCPPGHHAAGTRSWGYADMPGGRRHLPGRPGRGGGDRGRGAAGIPAPTRLGVAQPQVWALAGLLALLAGMVLVIITIFWGVRLRSEVTRA